MITVKHDSYGSKGVLVALEEDKKVGEMTYSVAGAGKIIVDHTEVDPSQSGKGIGKILFNGMIDYAKANDIKVLPLCPFAKAMFDKNPDLKDLLF